MGHYASEMGDPPDFQSEFEAERRRWKAVMPYVKNAFLAAVANWDSLSGPNPSRELWDKVKGNAQAAVDILPEQDLTVYDDDVRDAFYALYSEGYLDWGVIIILTELGKAGLNS